MALAAPTHRQPEQHQRMVKRVDTLGSDNFDGEYMGLPAPLVIPLVAELVVLPHEEGSPLALAIAHSVAFVFSHLVGLVALISYCVSVSGSYSRHP